MELSLSYDYGQTPISEEEIEELLIKTISTKAQLDEFEQKNIEIAVEWTMKQKFNIDKVLSIDFIQEVHKRMFGEVWGWAGTFRKSNKNIGVDKHYIYTELKTLIDDVNFWINNKTYCNDEIAIRYKHRLVKIHPFPNGNGRHSRLCVDILISHILHQNIFSWGNNNNLTKQGEIRKQYIDAILLADESNIKPLIKFARS
ncbi:MAG: mobile mystery protein B [Candidatus Marinimicrobia bacterium]|nr:mobile mystery protein B [Candidatus Neomarinimicrobiota bacterium]